MQTKPISLINPFNQQPLEKTDAGLKDSKGAIFKLLNGVYRFVEDDNYTQNFGFQWNKFQKTQIDRESHNSQSKDRFFAATGWDKQNLSEATVLEVGSGAGRFSQIVLEHTQATLYSVDYSNAVEANFRNNGHHGDRFHLFQASIYDLPFSKQSFDKVFCFGVLQHTPDFKKSVASLAAMVKPGGDLIVDFYPVRGWWTKIHAKYLLRPFTKNMPNEKLLALIERHADWMIAATQFFNKIGVGKVINRFIPICDIKYTLPADLTPEQLREWVILDTFDMFSPAYDHPQTLDTVKSWFEEFGLKNVWAGFVKYGDNHEVAIVKGIR